MDPEWRTDVYEGYRTAVIKIGNATVEVNRPILTPEEQAKREEVIRRALRNFRKG